MYTGAQSKWNEKQSTHTQSGKTELSPCIEDAFAPEVLVLHQVHNIAATCKKKAEKPNVFLVEPDLGNISTPTAVSLLLSSCVRLEAV